MLNHPKSKERKYSNTVCSVSILLENTLLRAQYNGHFSLNTAFFFSNGSYTWKFTVPIILLLINAETGEPQKCIILSSSLLRLFKPMWVSFYSVTRDVRPSIKASLFHTAKDSSDQGLSEKTKAPDTYHKLSPCYVQVF